MEVTPEKSTHLPFQQRVGPPINRELPGEEVVYRQEQAEKPTCREEKCRVRGSEQNAGRRWLVRRRQRMQV